MYTKPLTQNELPEDDSRDLIAMFDAARTPEQFGRAMRTAKMRERSHRAASKSTTEGRSQKRTRGFAGLVAALPNPLRAL